MAIGSNFGNTLIQMGKNLINDPAGFVGRDGLGATGKAISNSLPKMPTLTPVLQRALPGDNYREGDRQGSHIRDSFTPSGTHSHHSKQHSNNLQPGERNHHGGSFDSHA